MLQYNNGKRERERQREVNKPGRNSRPIHMKLEVNDLINSTDRYRGTNEKWVAKPGFEPRTYKTASHLG
jgi:hypothetical protein